MRALVVCRDGYGHCHPMVSIAAALRDAGHDVLVGVVGVIEEYAP